MIGLQTKTLLKACHDLPALPRNPYGNGTAVFTRSGAAARKFTDEIEAGQAVGDGCSLRSRFLGVHTWMLSRTKRQHKYQAGL